MQLAPLILSRTLKRAADSRSGRRLFLGASLALAILGSTSAMAAPPIRILPMGDSITQGVMGGTPQDGKGGYRGQLYYLLTAAGYNVDYVGSWTLNSERLLEREHDGHGGWKIDGFNGLAPNVADWFDGYADPDVVLLLIGTNDFGASFQYETAVSRLDALILKIAQRRPYAHIIVSNLLERAEPNNARIQQYFNPFVQGIVNAHAAAGRRVSFIDLRSQVPLSLMPDNLHPNQAGYNLMAQAWFNAIQTIVSPEGDSLPPGISRARVSQDRTKIAVTFSKPVAESAASTSRFTLSGGLIPNAAALDETKRVVTLSVGAPIAPNADYTVTVNGVQDRLASPNTIAPNSSTTFRAPVPRGYVNNVPESANYTLACSLDVPLVAKYESVEPAYSVDNRAGVGPFDRVAYYVELVNGLGDLQYLWVSMAAFTDDPMKLGVPTKTSDAVFQRTVSDLHIASNVANIANGEGHTGQLEFWPTDYTAPNATNVPGASSTLDDFGDTRSATGNYGSMQVHDATTGKTLFAFNGWGTTSTTDYVDIGLGSRPIGHPDLPYHPDWTFSRNGSNYTVRSIQVLVRQVNDTTAPVVTSAVRTSNGAKVVVDFSEPILALSATVDHFQISGATVLHSQVSANQRQIVLDVTKLPSGSQTLTLTGIRDTSANAIAPNTAISIPDATLPPEILSRVGAAANGYQLVYSADLPTVGNFNAKGASAYSFDDSDAPGTFTRVAYYLETQVGAAAPKYVWVSMDAFTTNRKLLGFPTVATGASFQQNLANMQVVSNTTTNGTALNGNIEFWPNSYGATRAAASPANASSTIFDFGDTPSATPAGWGSMQIHNRTTGETLFGINHFGVDGNALELGVGNNPSASTTNAGPQKDWTFAANAGTYTKRRLYVCVLPGSTPPPNDTTPPTLSGITPSSLRDRLVVSFTETLADTSARLENFSIPGLTITGARMLENGREIALSTSAQSPGTNYTLSINSGVRDRSPNANSVPPGTSGNFTAFATPALLSSIPEASDFLVVRKLAIPQGSAKWNTSDIPYDVDEAKYGEVRFDRVAYLLQLDSNWVYASFDPYVSSLSKLGIPSAKVTSAPFQQVVAHMNVFSNVPGIVTGTNIPTGNIEFWNGAYTVNTTLGLPGASPTAFDFDDTMSPDGTFGTMQIHNYGAAQTLFSYNNWGNSSAISDLGIGNNGSGNQDWTFAANANTYATRNLYVLARRSNQQESAATFLSQPTSRAVDRGSATSLSVGVSGKGPFTYQWTKNGSAIPNSNNPWLDITDFDQAKAGAYAVIVTDANGVTSTSLAASLVRSNRNPSFAGYSVSTNPAKPVVIPRSALLAKATDQDLDALQITGISATSTNGATVSSSATDVTYTPASAFLGPDSLSITIADEFGGTVSATVRVTVTAASLEGENTTLAARADGKVDVLFRGPAGSPASVQRSEDLNIWTTQSDLTVGDDGLLPFTDSIPSNKAFYKSSSQ